MSRVENSRIAVNTPGPWKLFDWERPLAIIDSEETLALAINSLADDVETPNRIVDLESPSGDKLSIGIAGPKDGDNTTLTQSVACVNFTDASLDPPYLTVVGDAKLSYENGGVVVFRYEGQWTEILRRNCVPLDVMLRIAQHFYATGTLPEWIAWEEV
jgi:Immunity protein Imm1